ncbi:23116_t:CDS:2, partial [Gigaspora rosea]
AYQYALETLYPTHHSWAICYTQTRFTASIQNEEAQYARINEQKNINPLVGLPHIASRYFSGIDSLIKEYLTPHNNFPSEPENFMENGYFEDDYERR